MTRRSSWYAALAAVAIPVLALVTLPGCGGAVGDCIETFEFEGTVVREGWSESECEEWCSTVNVGVHLSCYFSGALAAPTGPSVRREGLDGDPAVPRRS